MCSVPTGADQANENLVSHCLSVNSGGAAQKPEATPVSSTWFENVVYDRDGYVANRG
jgi:hypothetical protein